MQFRVNYEKCNAENHIPHVLVNVPPPAPSLVPVASSDAALPPRGLQATVAPLSSSDFNNGIFCLTLVALLGGERQQECSEVSRARVVVYISVD